MSKPLDNLPVSVTDHPYWRVNIRPSRYDRERIPTLDRCVHLVEHNTVRFRGWDYPHWAGRTDTVAYGNDWIASWTDFMGTIEYWRLYQSGQFVHLFAVREATESTWGEKLRRDAQVHLSRLPDGDLSHVPGFISYVNLVYTIAEITEFATRMAQSEVYVGPFTVSISISGISGFLLTSDLSRVWVGRFTATEDKIDNTWAFNSGNLIGDSVTPSVDIVKWFVARFGWLDPSTEVIERDIRNFKQGVT